MATKQFYATGSFKYGTRMLRAGDPVELDAPNARLFTALGKIIPVKPKAAKTETLKDGTVTVEEVLRPMLERLAESPAAKKVPAKRATKKRAIAKK